MRTMTVREPALRRLVWVVACLFCAPGAASGQPGTWSALPTPNFSRQDAAGAFVNDAFHVVGGSSGSGLLVTMESYGDGAPAWIFESPAPTARRGAGAAELDGKLYVVGGYTTTEDSGIRTTECWTPGPGGGFWTSLGNMSRARVFPAVVGADHHLWALGGRVAGVATSSVEIYDPVANQWNASAGSLLVPRAGAGVALLNGLFYVVGGESSGDYLSSMEAFDPVSGTSTQRAPMITGRARLGVMVMDGILYAIGGEDGPCGPLAAVEAYDPVTDRWTVAEPYLLPFSRMVAAGAGALGFVAGGYSCAGDITLGLARQFFERPPVFDPVGPQTVAEGQTLEFQVSAADPDGDAVQYWGIVLPPGAAFDSGTRTFHWVPESGSAGDYSALFGAGDGLLADSVSVGITVTSAVGVGVSPAGELAIGGVSPSPVAGPAIIALSLPRAGACRLELLDLAGRREAILLDGEAGPGTRMVRWDVGRPKGLPAGVYLLRLSQGPEAATRRVVVIR